MSGNVRKSIFTIEGPDAAGKATQAGLLAEYLGGAYIRSFPRYATPQGDLVRRVLTGQVRLEGATKDLDDALIVQALMSFDRYTCAEELRTLAAVQNVVLDRYWASGVVFGSEDGLDWNLLIHAHLALPQAAVSFLIDVPAEVQLERLRKRGRASDRYELAGVEVLERRRQAYLRLWKEAAEMIPHTVWAVIDGTPEPAEVHEQIVEHLRSVW